MKTDTPRSTAIRDNIHVAMVADNKEQSISHLEEAHREIEAMEKELTAASQEIDILKSKYADHHAEAERLTSEIRSVTEQRDRLAEALRQMWPFIEEDDYPNCNTPAFNAAILKYKEALQSLTTNANCPSVGATDKDHE